MQSVIYYLLMICGLCVFFVALELRLSKLERDTITIEDGFYLDTTTLNINGEDATLNNSKEASRFIILRKK